MKIIDCLSNEYIDKLPDDKIPDGVTKKDLKDEMEKLRNAIQNTKDEAKSKPKNKYGKFSFEDDWNVENCAEVWAARNAILNGAKFDNLIIKSVKTEDKLLFPLCKNCKVTFKGNYIIE